MSTSLRNPMQRARGLGSAKSGVGHWWIQRVTAVALIILTVWIVVLVLSLLHADPVMARATLARPLNSVLMIAFVVAMFWHGQLGLQVVIEDYIHARWLEITLLLAIKLLAVLGMLAGALAVLRIALGS